MVNPYVAAAWPIGGFQPFCHNAFETERASAAEDGFTVAVQMFGEFQAGTFRPQQYRQSLAALTERAPAQGLSVQLQKIKRIGAGL